MTARPEHRTNTLPEQSLEEHWWEGSSSSSEEERDPSEYDVGYLDLGTESPASDSATNLLESAAFVEQWAAAGVAVPRVPARRPSWRSTSFKRDGERSTGSKKEADDRDCGICFEFAVVPCRTLCCGKIFCTGHLADWLHGPNAEGRCPNCENACSLEGGTLSLATPTRLASTQAPPSRRNTITQSRPGPSPSPLSLVQPNFNDTLEDAQDLSRSPPKLTSGSVPPVHASSALRGVIHVSSNSPLAWNADAPSSTSESSATTISSDLTLSSDDDAVSRRHHAKGAFKQLPSIPSTAAGAINLSTTPFSTSWGAFSRILSIITFLMFLYKLLS